MFRRLYFGLHVPQIYVKHKEDVRQKFDRNGIWLKTKK